MSVLPDSALLAFLEEDGAFADVTTSGLDLPDRQRLGAVTAGEAGVASGMATAARVFSLLDEAAEWVGVEEGAEVGPGTVLLEVRARPAALLSGERVALNLLGRACGVATSTASLVAALAGSEVTLLDTRKTAPGLRPLDRAAVLAGGGANHRPDLSAMALVKENHAALSGGVGAAVAALKARHGPGFFVEAEVEGPDELAAALAAGADRVMLDDWPASALAAAVEAARAAGAEVEVSGGVTVESMPAIVAAAPDFVSSGAPTARAPSLDVSFRVSHLEAGGGRRER